MIVNLIFMSLFDQLKFKKIVLLLAIFFVYRVSFAETVSMQGKVSFPDGTAADVATITIGQGEFYKQAYLDDNGGYQILDLPDGKYNLSATGLVGDKAGRFVKKDIEIKNSTKEPITLDIVLELPTSLK